MSPERLASSACKTWRSGAGSMAARAAFGNGCKGGHGPHTKGSLKSEQHLRHASAERELYTYTTGGSELPIPTVTAWAEETSMVPRMYCTGSFQNLMLTFYRS